MTGTKMTDTMLDYKFVTITHPARLIMPHGTFCECGQLVKHIDSECDCEAYRDYVEKTKGKTLHKLS